MNNENITQGPTFKPEEKVRVLNEWAKQYDKENGVAGIVRRVRGSKSEGFTYDVDTTVNTGTRERTIFMLVSESELGKSE